MAASCAVNETPERYAGRSRRMELKTSSIYVDRLSKVLDKFNINLKRSQVLEIAAQAFGFHNSNEFTAASKSGALTPPALQPIGRLNLEDGQSLILVKDTLANSPYAIDEAFIEQVVMNDRAELIGATPYGNLAFLGNIADTDLPTWHAGQAPKPKPFASERNPNGVSSITLYIAIITHKNGTNSYTDLSSELLEEQIANYCIEFWDEIVGPENFPASPEGMNPTEIIETYFENHHCESLYRERSYMQLPEDLIVQFCQSRLPNAVPEIITPAKRPAQIPTDAEINLISATLASSAIADIWYDAEEFEDDKAGDEIEAAKDAMKAAAQILDQLTSKSTFTNVDTNSVIKIANSDGSPLINDLVNPENFDALSLSYRQSDIGFHPLTEGEETAITNAQTTSVFYPNIPKICHFAALHKTQKYHGIELIIDEKNHHEYADKLEQLKSSVAALGGHSFETYEYLSSMKLKFTILLPFDLYLSAGSMADYNLATDWLLFGAQMAGEKAVIAEFIPQNLTNDAFYNVSFPQQIAFDITFELLLMGSKRALNLEADHQERDELRFAHLSPPIANEWPGPFEVQVDQDHIAELFKSS